MDRSGNHVGHSDAEWGSPKRIHKKKLRNIAEVTGYASDLTGTSTKTPSIVGLENLRMFPADDFSVPTNPSSRFPKSPKKTGVEVFHPSSQKQDGRQHTKVYVKVVILKIGEIETIKEYFEADVFIQARWREPVLDNTQVMLSYMTFFLGDIPANKQRPNNVVTTSLQRHDVVSTL